MSEDASDAGTDTSQDAAAENILADIVSSDDGNNSDTGTAADRPDLSAELDKALKEAEKWRNLARKHETRAKDNADAASKAKTVEEQLGELRKAMADRDVADLERNGRLAKAQVKAKLAGSGMSEADMAGLFDLIDPNSLLTDGEPDEKAIDKLAATLTKVAGRATPDPDQGRSGGKGPADMNTLIRRAAGISV